MRKLIVLTFVTLDGIMQAPGGPDEDTSGDFKYGGWTVPYFEEIAGEEMTKQMTPPFDLLLGRKTYDIFAGYWPNQAGDQTGEIFNSATKYVVSHGPLQLNWEKSVLISGDVAASITELKATDGPALQVHGSGELIQTLLENDLVDELWLKIFPVILGSGKRLFGEGTQPAAFELIETKTSPKGVIFASYRRSGAVQTGSFD
jgi:dihydrofolate reductase